MRRVEAVVVVVAIGVGGLHAGCKKQVPTAAETSAEAERAATAKRAALPAVMTAAYMLERVRTQTARGMVVESLRLDYLRADGTFDPTFGEFDANLSRPLVPPPPPPDDPARPLGAPVPPPVPFDTSLPDCYDIEWSRAKLVDAPGRMCFPSGMPVGAARCMPAQIWARAIADGAPAAALARLHFTTATSVSWYFAIDDEPRGVHFSRTYADDCVPAVERGD